MRYLIVDDEPQARRLLQTFMEQIGGHVLVKQCTTATEAYENLVKEPVEFMFLDIQLPGMSGLELLESLTNPPPVILTTAFADYAVEAFRLNVVDYLLKPIALQRLVQSIEKVRKITMNNTPQDGFFIRIHHTLVNVKYDEIELVEGLQNYVKLHLRSGVLIVQQSMTAISQLLPEAYFIRVHRSYIIPVKKIKSISGNLLQLHERQIPIGITYKEDVLNKLVGR